MKKLLAGALAAVSASAVLGVVAPAAQAEGPDNCVSYPPGQPYILTQATQTRYTTKSNPPEKITVRAQKGKYPCAGYRVSLLVHYKGGAAGYHFVPDGSPYTSKNGYQDTYPANKATYGYFWYWRTPAGTVKETPVRYVIVS